MSTYPKHNVVEASNVAFGLKGFDEVTDMGEEEDAPTNGWFCFKAVGGYCTLSAKSVFGDDLSSTIIQNGDTVHGNFTAVTVTTGRALAYRN